MSKDPRTNESAPSSKITQICVDSLSHAIEHSPLVITQLQNGAHFALLFHPQICIMGRNATPIYGPPGHLTEF